MRRTALEGLFFRERDQKILAKVRAEYRRRAIREALRNATGAPDGIVDRILSLGVDTQSFPAFLFAPLIALAWADGRVDERERRAILDEIEAAGLSRRSAAHRVLEGWLTSQPPPGLMETWEDYIRALCRPLRLRERAWLASAIRWRAHAVASASGGILGPRFRESKDKIEILERMDRAFASS